MCDLKLHTVQQVSSNHEEEKAMSEKRVRTCSERGAADGFLSPPSFRCLLQAVTQALFPLQTNYRPPHRTFVLIYRCGFSHRLPIDQKPWDHLKIGTGIFFFCFSFFFLKNCPRSGAADAVLDPHSSPIFLIF